MEKEMSTVQYLCIYNHIRILFPASI